MQLNYRFKIDGTEMANPPANWDEFTLGIRYVDDLRVLLREYDSELVFIGTDYQTVYDLFENNSYDSKLTMLIEYTTDYSTWNTLISGYIRPMRCTIDPQRNYARIQIEDNTYASNLKALADLQIDTTRSYCIDGTTAITPVAEFDLGAYRPLGALTVMHVIDWWETFEYVIKYLTNGSVTVDSTWYDALDDYSTGSPMYYAIYYRWERPLITFKEMMNSLPVLYNLIGVVYMTSNTPYFKLIDESNLRSTASGISVNVLTQNITVDNNRIYSSVTVGDDIDLTNMAIYGGHGLNFSTSYELLSPGVGVFDRKTFPILDEAGIGINKEISCSMHYVLNRYYPIDKPQKPILVQYIEDSNLYSDYHTIDAALGYDYNDCLIASELNGYPEIGTIARGQLSLNNTNVLSRYNWMKNISDPGVSISSVTISVKLTDDEAYTEDSDLSAWTSLNILPIDVSSVDAGSCFTFDPTDYSIVVTGNRYETNRYTITGRFKADLANGPSSTVDLIISPYIFIFANKQTGYSITDESVVPNDVGSIDQTFSFDVNLPAGTRVQMGFILAAIPEDFAITVYGNDSTSESYFNIERLAETAQTIATGDDESAFIYSMDVDGHVNVTDWISVFNDPTKYISITSPQACKGWVDNAKYNPEKGSFNATLITNYTNLFP